MTQMAHILTQAGLSVFLNNRPYTIARTDKGFAAIRDAVLAGRGASDVLALIEENKRKLQTALSSTLTYSDGVILYRGHQLHNYAATKLIELIDAGLPIDPLVRFLDRLLQNPSSQVVERLYMFLEKGNLPLAPDGRFLAYKAVRADYKDIHSGTFDNSVGQVLRIPRNQVDDDMRQTCSRGLHVCSFDYLATFAQSNGHVVAVSVDPIDVVAIPYDYNDTKMRVCAYVVVADVTDAWNEKHRVLSDTPVYDARKYDVIDAHGSIIDSFNDFEAALFEAQDSLDEDDCPTTSVIRVADGVTVASFSV